MKSLNAFKYVLKFTWKHQKSYIFILFFSEIVCICEMFTLVYFPKIVIDGLISGDNINVLCGIILIFGTLLLGTSLLKSWLKYFIWKKQCFLQKKLICLVMQKTARIDYENLENPLILDLKKKAEKSYLGNASDEFFGVLKYFFSMASGVLSLVGLFAILFEIGIFPWMILNLVIIANCIFEAKTIKKNFHLEEESIPYERRWQYYRDIPLDLKAIKEIKIFQLSSWFIKKFSDVSRITNTYYTKTLNNTCKTESLCAITIFVREIFSYVYIVISVLMKKITVGDFSLYISSIEKYSDTLKEIIQNAMEMSHVGQYVECLQHYFELPECICTQGNAPLDVDDKKIEIEFKNVFFKYPNAENYTLKNINFKIRDGEHISIVGENGAGKSTLIKLLCRLYVPSQGEIFINGVNINKYSLEEYNRLLAPVFQDFQLFSINVQENLCLDGEWNQRDAEKILGEVALGYLPSKYENFFGRQVTKLFDKNGLVLSGGEQQKIAIARALYQKGKKIIVLDEPTAALDPRSEAEIYYAIDKLTEDKMSIFISHRLSSCKYCDHIVVLQDGSLIEYGTHEELMQKKGIYFELFELQAERYRD